MEHDLGWTDWLGTMARIQPLRQQLRCCSRPRLCAWTSYARDAATAYSSRQREAIQARNRRSGILQARNGRIDRAVDLVTQVPAWTRLWDSDCLTGRGFGVIDARPAAAISPLSSQHNSSPLRTAARSSHRALHRNGDAAGAALCAGPRFPAAPRRRYVCRNTVAPHDLAARAAVMSVAVIAL